MLKLLLPLSILLLFLSCGGTSQHEPREIKTLYFKGSAVNGIDYHCGERQGVTKTIRSTDGAITCVYSPVEFYLGSLYLDGSKTLLASTTTKAIGTLNQMSATETPTVKQ
jgi:hypothetical protein